MRYAASLPPRDDEGVERAGRVVGDLEHAGHDRGAGCGRRLGDRVANGPSAGSAYGAHVRAGLAEVAGERLGEHHQVGAAA